MNIEQRKFEEEVISGLDESNIAYSIQSELYSATLMMHRAYRMLLETVGMKKEEIPEEMVRQIEDIIDECGGSSNHLLSKEEMAKIQKEKREEKKRKQKVQLTPFGEDDWRSLLVC